MGERLSPQAARDRLKSLGVEDEDSYFTIMDTRHSQPQATSHELKTLVVIAMSSDEQDYDKVYSRMRKRYPQR